LEDLVTLLKDEYLQAIFYFLLKKTSNHYEAEDLSQEVVYEILNALDHGTVPNDFNAWVWQITRNRYARWAERNKRSRNYVSISDLDDILSDNTDVSDSIIKFEELAYLRRELSLLHSDYSKIVAEYYFNNRSITEIAEMVSLPIGTVKRKLHECRNNLKEGIKMSRTYGTRSFNPDDIMFYSNWSKGEFGHKYAERGIPCNILLEAYDNASTAEDLSLALGIALPYMEEEIGILHHVGLLIKDKDNRYLTNCTIISKQAQIDVDNKLTEIASKFNPLLIETIESLKNEKIFGGYQSFEDMKLSLIVMLIRYMETNSPSANYSGKATARPNDSEWDLYGFEQIERKYFPINFQGMSNYLRIQMITLSNFDHELYTEEESTALWNVMNDKVTDTDIPYLDKLCTRNIVKKTADNKYLPMFAIVNDYEEKHLLELAKKSHFDELVKLKQEYVSYANARYKKDIPNYLANSPWTNDSMLFEPCAIEYAVNNGYMKIPADPSNSAVGLLIWNQ